MKPMAIVALIPLTLFAADAGTTSKYAVELSKRWSNARKLAVAVADEVHRPIHQQAAGVIQPGNLLAGVDQRSKREFVIGAELPVTAGALGIDAEDDGVALLGLRPVVAELAKLLAADHGVIGGIEHQYDVLAALSGKLDSLTALGRQFKIRGLCADRKGIGKEPGEHTSSLPLATVVSAVQPAVPASLAVFWDRTGSENAFT
jgi:hypothetical protein